MNKTYDVVIIGGGGNGLSLAYNLAKRSKIRIAVIEKNYLGSGASGRNGESIRSAFGHEAWIRFYNESVKLWENISSELSFNVMFTRCGYLVLATSNKKMAVLNSLYGKQKNLGVKCVLLDSSEIIERFPSLNKKIVVGGILQTNSGYARHDAVVWAYAQAAKKLNVDIHEFTEVLSIDVKNGEIKGLKTSAGNIETNTIVNAAGGHCAKIASMTGLDLPVKTYRLEMIATEPVKPFLKPYISALDQIGYMHQTARGEFIGGTEPPGFEPSMDLKSTLFNLKDMANKFVELFPCLSGVNIMRQWSGLMPTFADAAPALGPVDQVKGFILNCGWTYGFMAMPASGKYLAEFIDTGEMPPIIKPFSIDRFRTGELLLDPSLVVEALIDD